MISKKKQEKNLLLVDLDQTLIDTNHFKKNLFSSLADASGTTPKTIEGLYLRVRQNSNIEGWTFQFSKLISKKTGGKSDKYHNLIFKQIKKIRIINPVLSFVKNTPGNKIIFTFGDHAVQTAKIKHLNLRKYFDDTIVTSKNKYDYLKTRIEAKKITIQDSDFYNLTIIDDQDQVYKNLLTHSWIKIIHPDTLME